MGTPSPSFLPSYLLSRMKKLGFFGFSSFNNLFLTFKGEISDNPMNAIEIFNQIVTAEADKDVSKRKWTFKSLQFIIIMSVKANEN